MNAVPVVGLLDSGVPEAQAMASRRFALGDDGTVESQTAHSDSLGHGTALAALILARAPAARLLNAQIFDHRGITSPAAAAAGIRWLTAAGARLINLSFGLTQDRAVLAEACAQAVKAGVLLVASTPAMGPCVFPAAYPGIVKVTGDGRCHGDDIAWLDGARADFGASPRPVADSKVAGASVAAARVTAALAQLLAIRPERENSAVLRRLAGTAAHRGLQREHYHDR
ncbi:conserved hypothetical protein [Candidatus Terasakiella magnetica]|nr:conserved hypothetical protein [Candidatus Terasakiella magnetica]